MLKLKPEDLEKYTDKDGNIRFDDDVIFEGNLDCRGYLDCGGNLNCGGNLDWSHASLPDIPEKNYIKSIMPQSWQRDHYQERLGFELVGCYESIRKQVGRKIFNLLKDEKWLPIERKMLELIRDYDKPAPEWVSDLEKLKSQAA